MLKDILVDHIPSCLVNTIFKVGIQFSLINVSVGGKLGRVREIAWDLIGSTVQDIGLDRARQHRPDISGAMPRGQVAIVLVPICDNNCRLR